MTEGKTKSGFKFKFDEAVIRDQDFLDAILDAKYSTNDTDKLYATRNMYLMVLGNEGYNSLKEHVRKNNNGICDTEIVAKEFGEIIDSVPALKN